VHVQMLHAPQVTFWCCRVIIACVGLPGTRALSTEIFVGKADSWVDTVKDECLTWMGEECSAAHSVDVNLDLQLGLRAYYVSPGSDTHRLSTGELCVCTS